MADQESYIQRIAPFQATSMVDEARPSTSPAVLPEPTGSPGSSGLPDSTGSPPAPAASVKPHTRRDWGAIARDVLLRLWRSRGLFGGLAAIGVAFLGQQALLAQNDFATSTRNYLIAFALIILTLMHPSLPKWLRRAKRPVAQANPAIPSETQAAALVAAPPVNGTNGANGFAPASEPLQASVSALSPIPDALANTTALIPVRPTHSVASTLPIRQHRPEKNGTHNGAVENGVENSLASDIAAIEPVTPSDAPSANGKRSRLSLRFPALIVRGIKPAAPLAMPKANPWVRYKALRGWLGWRVTALGLLVTVALAAWSALVLKADITSPLGGWLWAAALSALLLTFLGAPGRSPDESLLPSPDKGFFANGMPKVPIRLEAVFVVIIMLVAIIMRVYNLEYHPGIHGDEGEQGTNVRAIIEGQPLPFFGIGWWSVPNLAFYIWQFPMRVFGDANMVGDRMFGVISGLLAVWFVYRTGKLLFGTRAGLIAGAMLAVSPFALQNSRFANVSAETLALWAIGFYFFFMALRYRRWSDWALAGFLWALNLYFYPSGKLIIPLIGVVGLYCLLRWRLAFFKRYFLGFVLLGVAFLLTFMPYIIYSTNDNWLAFAGRANETSIFSPQNQPRTFQQYGLTYDPTWANHSMVDNFKSNPTAWASLVYQQTRETLDLLYKRGDASSFYYTITEHNGSLLQPLWAALGLLALVYALFKLFDARFGIILLWFAIGMSGAIFTADAPNAQRIVGAWPAMMILPAVLLDRVAASGWPLSRNLARRWTLIPLAALLIYFGVDSAREYFVHFYATCPMCRDTTQARYIQALGQEYKGYQLGVGGYDVYFGYGSSRQLGKGVEGTDVIAAADDLPILDNNGKGAAFIVYANNNEYLPMLRLFYPQGQEEPEKSHDGTTWFTSYKITLDQLKATRTLHSIYTPQTGTPIQRDEPNLGTGDTAQGAWSPPDGLTFPATAEWRGGLVAPSYGDYTFSLEADAPNAVLELDGNPILRSTNGNAPVTVEMVLARGMHDVRLSGALRDANGKLQVSWSAGGSGAAPAAVDPLYLFNGPTNGLSGEVGPLALSAPDVVLKQPDPFDGKATASRRSDPFIGFREGSVLFGNPAFVARWQGKLNVMSEGDYAFNVNTPTNSAVIIDGKTVFGNGPDGTGPGPGMVHLTAGAHDLDVRYVSPGGFVRIELSWTPPGGPTGLIPPTVLTPAARSWARGQMPDAPQAVFPAVQSEKLEPVKPDMIFSGDELSTPRGLAVDKEGNVYVGDKGHNRIVVYSPEGKVIHSWGTAAPEIKDGQPPPPVQGGQFYELHDVAVGDDGTVYVLDFGNRVQAFSSTGEYKGSYEPDQLGLYGPTGVAAGGSGKASDNSLSLYIAVTGQNRILKLPTVDKGKSAPGQAIPGSESIAPTTGDLFEQPVDMVEDPTGSGMLYVMDLKDRLMQLTPQAGANGGPRTWTITRQWHIPVGREDNGSRLAIAPDAKHLYMTDPERRRVAVLDVKTGKITYFGGEGHDPGQFGSPNGIAVGQDGRVYVLDSANHNVQVFAPGK